MARRADLRDALRVPPGKHVSLEKLDTGATHGWERDAARPRSASSSSVWRAPGPPLGRGEAQRSWSSCRASMPPARTARSTR